MPALRPAACFALLVGLLAGPAAAQITPEQVWDHWRSLATASGYDMTLTAQRRDGDRLVLDGVQATMLTDTMALRMPVGQVIMRDRGDGSVEVTMEPAFDIGVTITEPDSEPVEMTVTVEQDGYVVVVSGTPAAPRHDVTAESLTIGLAAPMVNGAEMPMDMVVSLGGLRGSTILSQGTPMGITYDLSAEAMELAVSSEDPKGEGTFDLSVGAQALTSRFDGTLPGAIAPGTALSDAMAAGLRGKGGYSAGAIEFGMDLTSRGVATSVAGTATSGSVDVALDPAGLTYRTGLTGLDVTASGGAIPFPELTFSLADYALGLTMPLTKSAEPSDFGLLIKLVDLVVAEDVWAMFDPTATLPRDPASLVLDAKGKATLFHDLTSPEAEQTPAFGQVNSLSLDALQLKAAGADLTGTGAFTFDNTDMTTFPGFPRPAGVADLKLVGGNALLDKLTALGLVPADQVMVARMGMAMFTRPGDGPDTLTSKIEITPDAQILANGQRIQ